jgi:hypothetical protein
MVRIASLAAACAALALAGCETVNEAVNDAAGDQFRAQLSGANEPAGGDPDGAGLARIEINNSTNTVCTDLEIRQISPATAAHIHRGAAGVNGPPVITLDTPDDNDSDDCDEVDQALIDEIRANPAGFYVNVHTADFPDGAIRGQLVNIEG